MERYTKEETFAIIDEKLKSIKERLPAEQQMNMEEFHLIFTQSNELIQVVDCRSQEEYDACHISGSKRLEEWHKRRDWGRAPIRTFYYSRIGERSAEMVAEEAKKGIRAYNVNGGIIEWLHYKGFCDCAEKSKTINVVDKEFAPMVPEPYTPIFNE